MNAIFTAIFFAALLLFLFTDPDLFLASMLKGGQKAATLTLSLLSVYCVWLGFFKVMERSGAMRGVARITAPLARKLFRTRDEEAIALSAGNLSANLLGLPGAPTPLGIRATKRFLATGHDFAAEMLFVLNATSLQLLPTTVIALRLAMGSLSPADIFLPTLLTTAFTTLLGVFLLLMAQKCGRRRK